MPKIHRDRPPTNAAQESPKPQRVVVTGLFVGSEAALAAQIDQALTARSRAKRPVLSARKDKWVAYAKSLGLDATGTKGQIMERVTDG